jgi:predicted transcriptional regulator of viral defense system
MDEATKERISKYIAAHSGVIRTKDFQRAGFHNSYLSELTAGGRLVRLKAGLYIAVESQTVAGFYEIQLALPSAVICLASALAYYELTTYEPPAVHVATPRYNLGIAQEQIEGHVIRIYDREKTICDSIRFRRVLGQDVVNEAVHNYLGGRKSDVDRLIEYSQLLRGEGPVKMHLRLMT